MSAEVTTNSGIGPGGPARADAPGSRISGADRPYVSVLVPMLNERGYIEGCLASLLAQDYPPERYEILVVDGLSTDGSRDVVAARCGGLPAVRLLDNPRRIPASALNVGVGAALGEVVMRLDAHSYAAEDFITSNVQALRRSGAAGVGGPIQSIARGYIGHGISVAMSSPFGVGGARFRYAKTEQWVDTVAFGAYPRHIMATAGPFDEDLMYCEDNEFNDRIRRQGGRILLTPSVRSWYYTRESLRGLWTQYYRYGRGRARLLLRFPDTLRWRHLAPLALVAGLLAGCALLPLDPLLLAVPASAYAAAVLLASLVTAWRRGWKYLSILPVAYACMHFSYGVGTLWGFITAPLRPRRGSSPTRGAFLG